MRGHELSWVTSSAAPPRLQAVAFTSTATLTKLALLHGRRRLGGQLCLAAVARIKCAACWHCGWSLFFFFFRVFPPRLCTDRLTKMVPTGVCWCTLVYADAHWCMLVHIGVYWWYTGAYWCTASQAWPCITSPVISHSH